MLFAQPNFLQQVIAVVQLYQDVNIVLEAAGGGKISDDEFGGVVGRAIVHHRKILGGIFIKEIAQHYFGLVMAVYRLAIVDSNRNYIIEVLYHIRHTIVPDSVHHIFEW